MRLTQAFTPLSSSVDWCEPNYQVTNYIVEFVNTITNIPLVVFPVVQFCYYLQYARYCQQNLRYLLITLQLVGIGSAYYHATLSFAGQLIDECGILWSLSWLSAGYWPHHLFPFGIKSRSHFTLCYIFVTFCCTVLSISKPECNQFFLIVFGAPFVITIIADHFVYRTPTKMYTKCFPAFMFGFLVAFIIWGLDKSFCPLWRALYIPYLHGVWHILSAYATAYGIVLCIHEDLTRYGFASENVRIRYFPDRWKILGIPCADFKP